MEIRCQIKDVSRTLDGEYIIAVRTASINPEEVNALQGDLRVTFKKWKEKRSLDANGYLWILVSMIAETLKSSKEEVYEALVRDYGLPYKDDDGYITVTLRSDIDINKIDGHWKLFRTSDDGKYKAYLMLRGTSDYDTSEMSGFLDRVISDAKDLGIETMTPDELERLKGYERLNLNR